MKIATYNVNGVNGRLPVLLRWLEESVPDIVCLQELKAPDEKFPERAIRDLGYDVIWHGQKSWNGVAILSRVGQIHETSRGLPGDPQDTHSRYIEAAVNGVLIGGLYLPNGNPRPGPKFDYKLRWFERLIEHAEHLLGSGLPVILAGDFNVMPTDLDVYKPERWLDDALFAPEVKQAYFRLLSQGWTDALRTRHPGETIYTFWDYFRNAYARNAGLRIDHLLLSPSLADRLVDAQVDRHVRGWEKTSDHAPVWIELAEKAKRTTRAKGGNCGKAEALSVPDEGALNVSRTPASERRPLTLSAKGTGRRRARRRREPALGRSAAAGADEMPLKAEASLADRARDTFERVKESRYGLPAAIGIGSAALLAALLYARRSRHDEPATPRPPSRARRKAGADA